MEGFKRNTSLVSEINKYLAYVVGAMLVIGTIYVKFMLGNAMDKSDESLAIDLQNRILSSEENKKSVALGIAVTIASNSEVVKSLELNDRAYALDALNNLGKSFKNGTPYKNVKIHIHTKDVKSFVRDWKPEKFGDDLSGFRASIVQVKETKKPVTVVEVGVTGLVLRGIAPIFNKSGEYVGSVEAIMGFNSIVKEYKKEKMDLIVLMDDKLAVGDKFKDVPKIFNYYISQEATDEKFKTAVSGFSAEELSKEGFLETSDFFIVTAPIKDLSGKTIGKYVVGLDREVADGAVNAISSLVMQISLFGVLILAIMFVMISVIAKKTIANSLEIFTHKFNDFVDFLSYRTNKYVPAQIVVKDEFGELINHLNDIAIIQDAKLKEDMKVIGEIVLVTDKVEQGIYQCRIHASSKNPMVETLRKTVNSMIEAMDSNMTALKSTLEQYTNNDFTKLVSIDPKLKSDMLAVMQSVNKLGEALRTNAKLNLSNGETLNHNAITMSESVNNVAAKANQQAASLEETAAALE
ncbi:MAG: cache domain-containing protein, partial [Arcobacteraceae bacterium]|nr:cache domain-containing protein [Arcobacteraceae bacterium]